MKRVPVYLGLGSNLAPEQNICSCLQQLSTLFGELQCATVYQSAAVGFEGPTFLNTVVGLKTDLAMAYLQQILRQMEHEHGRERGAIKFSSRSLDIDLLLYGQSVAETIKLPHPDILAYPFVLFPLAEIAPDYLHPVLKQTIGDIAASSTLDRSSIRALQLNCS